MARNNLRPRRHPCGHAFSENVSPDEASATPAEHRKSCSPRSRLVVVACRHRLGGPDVVVVQGAEAAVSGLCSDPVDRSAVQGGRGGVSGAERVT